MCVHRPLAAGADSRLCGGFTGLGRLKRRDDDRGEHAQDDHHDEDFNECEGASFHFSVSTVMMVMMMPAVQVMLSPAAVRAPHAMLPVVVLRLMDAYHSRPRQPHAQGNH